MVAKGLLLDDRFNVEGLLGEGAQGNVYRAFDAEAGGEVAIKLMHPNSIHSMLELKHEFRIAKSLLHPNLVRLHELFVTSNNVYFSMELIDGPKADKFFASLDEEKKRQWLAEFLLAVVALHDAGRLHRDLKPDNVLIRENGSPVLLDYGFMTPRVQPDQFAIGTYNYLAPELFSGSRHSTATDTFGAGVVIWELLSQSKWLRSNSDNITFEALDTLGLGPLLERLVSVDPKTRPSSFEIKEQLRQFVAPVSIAPDFEGAIARELVVGRGEILSEMDRLWQLALYEPRIFCIYGVSGSGKTTLASTFVRDSGATCWRGRCGPREDVPYNAIDALIDVLLRTLLQRDVDLTVAAGDIGAIALKRLFPQLGAAIAAGADAPMLVAEHELLRRAAIGLLKLCNELSGSNPIVWLDDVQWADEDSLRFLRVLVEEARHSAIFIVFSSRLELDFVPSDLSTEIWLEPLALEDMTVLAKGIAGKLTPEIEAMVARCEGSPLLLHQMIDSHVAGEMTIEADVDKIIAKRTEALPPHAIEVIQALALFAKPIELRLLEQVVGGPSDVHRTFYLLSDLRLVTGRKVDVETEIEMVHDRVRESVFDNINPDTVRSLHHKFASALVAEGEGRLEEVVFHYAQAGALQEAGSHALAVARRLMDTLALTRAVEVLELLIGLDEPPIGQEVLLQMKAGALAKSGCAAEAARDYLAVSKLSPDNQVLQNQRNAFEQFLRVGHVDEGLEILNKVIGTLAIPFPKSLPQMAVGLVRAGVYRVLRFNSRPELLAEQIDACFSAGLGLNMLDVRRSMYFHYWQLALVGRTNDAYRRGRALAVDATYNATLGLFDERTAKKVETARQLAGHCENGDELLGFVELCGGVAKTVQGDFREALELLDSAEARLVKHHDGVTWELVNCQLYRCWDWIYLSDIGSLQRELPAYRSDARIRGDDLASLALCSGLCVMGDLSQNEPERCAENLERVKASLPQTGFQSLNYFYLVGMANCLLYQGQGEQALDLVKKEWPLLRKGLFLNMRYFRAELLFLRARACLASAISDDETRQELLKDARRCAKRLAKMRFELAQDFARVVYRELASQEPERQTTEVVLSTPLLEHLRCLQAGELNWSELADPQSFSAMWMPCTSRRLDQSRIST